MNTKLFLAAILLLSICPAVASAAQLSSGGFDFRVQGRQRGDRLDLSGRVSGQACSSLVVTAYLQNERSERERVNAVVTDLSSWGSKLVEGGPVTVETSVGSWEIYRLDARCQN